MTPTQPGRPGSSPLHGRSYVIGPRFICRDCFFQLSHPAGLLPLIRSVLTLTALPLVGSRAGVTRVARSVGIGLLRGGGQGVTRSRWNPRFGLEPLAFQPTY